MQTYRYTIGRGLGGWYIEDEVDQSIVGYFPTREVAVKYAGKKAKPGEAVGYATPVRQLHPSK